MGIFTSYFKTGQTAEPDKFLKIYKNKAKYAEYSYKARDMISGALKAFGEGHPENVQIAIAHAEELESSNYRNFATHILNALPAKYGDKLTDINMALAQVPEQEKTEFLSKVLNTALMYRIGDDKFYALLLKAGADANACINGHPASLLVTATCNKHSIGVIKMLHENGANFDDALTTMHCQNRDTSDIERLHFFQEKIEGASAAKQAAVAAAPDSLQSEDVRVLLAQILEQMQEITKRLPPAPAEQDNVPQPRIKKQPPKGKGYPHL